ncbi:DMP19 family protein [Candidatus Stoquefichus massiliensis]|uniref:DMP19 family protein n=1 Tax=Candidatus Stoquefichus massiliensis TaxID=1470350 RepID=UPI00048A040F|nr:DUF4375 domain-containing protein [Candidatus Stoquefichus massiliensis]
MDWKIMLVWVLFIGSLVFLGYFFIKRIKKNKQIQKEAQRAYQERREKYTYLKPGIFDECPREDVSAAALFHCLRKEAEDFDHYFENMTHPEIVVYGIYLVSSSIEGSGGSLHSFFLSPANKPFVPMIVDIFEEVGSHEIADLMRAARRFAEIIENDEEDDENDPDMGDYTRYNFTDFTNEFIAMVSTTNLNEKLIKYILDHKEDFYDYNIPEETNENGVEEDEGISE